jgi:hypothetical protein
MKLIAGGDVLPSSIFTGVYMNRFALLPLPLLLAATSLAADPSLAPWQKLTSPTVAQAAAQFPQPPRQYSLTLTWGWQGEVTPAIIARDLDAMLERNVHAATIECGRVTNAPYLTPAYFDLVKTVVAEAKKRNMHLWFINESKYPTGFAGGKFSNEAPGLRMQLVGFGQRFTVGAGKTFDEALPEDTLCVIAVNPADQSTLVIPPAPASAPQKYQWTAPASGPAEWEVVVMRHYFDTAPTRSSSSPNGAKDKRDSLMDYLNPAATKQFIEWTHEQYKKAVGEEFGKTILGFRGDEPEYPEGAQQPFTPAILTEFQKKKGYDPRPWLPAIISNQSELQRRAHADYVDIWSDLYARNFFTPEAAWCAANGLELQYHLDHEERLMSLVRSDGDFFKTMRDVQVPGVDAIQNQIAPGTAGAVNRAVDFPKLASSAAHLNGRPTAMCEAFAAYVNNDIPAATWVINHLMVRGINRMEFMFFSSGSGARAGRGYLGDARFAELAAYTNRSTWLLAQGKPAAQIALYCPTTSFWYNDSASYSGFLAVTQQLLESQRDLDFVDEAALASDLKLDKSAKQLMNLSGQGYSTVIIPQCSFLSKAALDNLKAFREAGGTVIVLGTGPAFIADKNFKDAAKTTDADLAWATRMPQQLSADHLKSLPADLSFDKPLPAVKYNRRILADGDVYMLFNESDQPAEATLTLPGGTVQQWDPRTGKIAADAPLPAGETGRRSGPISLAPHETRFYVTTRR